MEPDLDELLDIARAAALRAGAELRDRFAAPARDVQTKSSARDLVSAADHAAEDDVRDVLASARPGDGVLGEEGEETPSRTGLRWVVDPLDGTWNFLHGVPHWCVSVGCEDASGGLVGVVYDPLREELFAGARERGARLDDGALTGPDSADLASATVGGEFSGRSEELAETAHRIVMVASHVRQYGSTALDLAWLAAGRWDAVYHARRPAPWDVAAGAVLCGEVGVVVERLPDDRLVAALPPMLDPLRGLVSDAPQAPHPANVPH